MLSDKEIMPICKRYARIFYCQASKSHHIGPGAYDEMLNEAYVVAKKCSKLRVVAVNVKWALVRYVEKKTFNKTIDRRIKKIENENALLAIEEKEQFELLSKAVSKLSTKEQYLIEYYFYRHLTLKEIAKEWSCSFQWVSQLLKQTLKKLKREIDGKSN